MWTSHQNFLQNHPTPPTPFQSCFWGCCPAGNSGEQPQSPSQAPAVPGRWASYWRGQPHSQTPTPHMEGGDRATRWPADTPPTRHGHPRWSGLAWQLPALSAPSLLGNPLPGAWPSPAEGQLRGEKPQAREEPGAAAAPASL